MPLRPIFYDTETTGIKADKERIVELAAYDPFLDKTFVQLINPGMPIPSEASAIHHISNEMVADAPNFNEVIPEFLKFCDGDVILIAHNNDAFDLPFMQCEFNRCSQKMPDHWKFLDSLKWARRYRSDLPRHTLQYLREIYFIKQNNAHRALDDVIVLHQVFTAMTDDIPIEEAYRLLSIPKDVMVMPFGKHQGKPLAQLPKDYVAWLVGSGAFDKPDNQQLKASLQKLNLLPS